ncbi:MAG TPA: RluA family pseudouridine synthase [Anaerolineae bacterium]|nr:RluA family pseudouridine synthase [Anaerolineae bacterium]HNU02715.1 RluA family pseudouridine synthase [Anaerolineae bacterium]
MAEPRSSLLVGGLAGPVRLDRLLRDAYPEAGRQAINRLIGGGQVTVNGQTVRLNSWLVRNGDRLTLLAAPPAKPTQVAAFDDAWIIAEDDELLAVNKPAGLLSEPARAAGAANLLELASARFGPLTLFHRLDRDTSGAVLLTRGGAINRYLDEAFKRGAVRKEYQAVVASPNRLAAQGTIEARLSPHPQRRDMMTVAARGGQRAVTRYEVVAEAGGCQWLLLWPETGRTHQLRVHLASLHAPILGDRLYNPAWQQANRLMLHAGMITLPSARGWPERSFVAPAPGDFLALPSARGG